jgi:hypothetical protein
MGALNPNPFWYRSGVQFRSILRTESEWTESEYGWWDEMKSRQSRILREVLVNHNPYGLSTAPAAQKRSESETNPDYGSKVVVAEIGDAGFMRNGDGQTAVHPGIRNPGKAVETFGEVMVRIEGPLV